MSKTAALQKAALFAGLEPDDVVGAVEGYEHQAFLFGRAGEPVRRFAGHHGKAARTKHDVLHPFHSGGDVSFYDDQLLFRGVIVRRNHALGRRLHDGGAGTSFQVAIFQHKLQAVRTSPGGNFTSESWRTMPVLAPPSGACAERGTARSSDKHARNK